VIIGVGQLGLYEGDLPLSITSRTDRGVTRYERGGERSFMSIDGDHRRSVVGASGSKSGRSG